MLIAQSQPDPAQASALAAALFYLFAGVAAGSAVLVVASKNIVRTAVALLFTLAGVAGLYFLLAAEFLAAVQLVVYAGGTLILIIFGVMLTTRSPFSRFEPKAAEVVVAVTVALVLLAALVMAVPVSETSAPLAGGGRMAGAFAALPSPLREKVRAGDGELSFRGPMSAAERQDLLAAVDAEQQARLRRAEESIGLAVARDGEASRAAVEQAVVTEREVLAREHAAARAAVEALAVRSQRFFFADRPLPAGEAYPVGLLGEKLLGEYLLPFELVSVLLLVVMIGAAYLAKARRRVPTAEGNGSAGHVDAGTELSRQAKQWT